MIAVADLLKRQADAENKKVIVGFDGFIDSIVRPVRQSATEDHKEIYFQTIEEFGQFLTGNATKSCSIELIQEIQQSGGNLPYFSRSLGNLGIQVDCIGMLGANGKINDYFKDMPCHLFSYADPGQSTCFEFQDGKILFSTDYKFSEDPWELILKATSGRAADMFRCSDLLVLVNWSELSFAHHLWEQVLTSMLEYPVCDKSRVAFFDLCDCTRRTGEDISSVLQLIGHFSTLRTTVLSLNENEALVVARRILGYENNLSIIAREIRELFRMDEVVIHTIRESILATERGITSCPSEFVSNPKISTGAGDNFNAALCFGTLMKLTDEEKIAFANRYTSFYISNGFSPTLNVIMETFE